MLYAKVTHNFTYCLILVMYMYIAHWVIYSFIQHPLDKSTSTFGPFAKRKIRPILCKTCDLCREGNTKFIKIRYIKIERIYTPI